MIESFVAVPRVAAELYAPHADAIAAESDVIESLRTDKRTNCLVVTSQAQNVDAATEELRQLIQDENLISAASSMGLTLPEVRSLRAMANSAMMEQRPNQVCSATISSPL